MMETKHTVLGILAHVDAGKTTLSEAMLYCSGRLKTLGRVDHKNSFLDTHTLERERGITIFSKQALLDLPHTHVSLLDTPGHVDFAAEAERTLQVLDYAVLVISGTDGVQAHTDTLWRLLRRYRVPTFLFVTKMDLPGPGRETILAELQRELDESCQAADGADRDERFALWVRTRRCRGTVPFGRRIRLGREDNRLFRRVCRTCLVWMVSRPNV